MLLTLEALPKGGAFSYTIATSEINVFITNVRLLLYANYNSP